MPRLNLRVVGYDSKGKIDQVIEQEMPATAHDIRLALRRKPFALAVAHALLNRGKATFERRDD